MWGQTNLLVPAFDFVPHIFRSACIGVGIWYVRAEQGLVRCLALVQVRAYLQNTDTGVG